MMQILATEDFYKSAQGLLHLATQLISANTVFVAINDRVTNRIILAQNRDQVLIEEGLLPFVDAYCHHVCANDNVLSISNTATHPLTSAMRLTASIGPAAFIGAPIMLKNGAHMGTVCALNPLPHEFRRVDEEILMASAQFLGHVADLEYQTYIDSTTKTFTQAYLERAFARWPLSTRDPVSALVVHIPLVELIRGLKGFTLRDRLLAQVSQRIRHALPEEDILARISETEFAVLTRAGDSEATTRAHAIIRHFRDPIEVEAQHFVLSPSIGIATAPTSADNLPDLIQHATITAYLARQEHTSRVRNHHPKEEASAAHRLEIASRLPRAHQNGEFSLHYQPKYVVSDERPLVSAEALIRWQQPDESWISPSDFIPVAEATGFIAPLGRWALREACRQTKHWQDLGYPRIVISVNISPRQFELDQVDHMIQETLQETRLDPHWLAIEITEGLLVQNSAAVAETLNRIRQLGVSIAIDDFGKGFSSLAYLGTFEPHALKIDQAFIADMLKNPKYYAIVAATINMAHDLDMNVVAEGVETEAQWNALEALHCDVAQGYLRGRPVPADVFESTHLAPNRKIVPLGSSPK
ncbi:EAL domain-containing protein [Sulfobacillus harzensis]|uniref:EAL domain-containing protein n=1 Tax=Sulfobacillus harzensis TaxID=2729629 RepID=A0A7Y0L7D5_9FIRM|nr:EAL domain-containing protein [Sulfobacillus harzensis]NMP23289.1 EAL domain-containing protein [Sulfobacillus harzensis]